MNRLKQIPENIRQKIGSLTDLFMNDPEIIIGRKLARVDTYLARKILP